MILHKQMLVSVVLLAALLKGTYAESPADNPEKANLSFTIGGVKQSLEFGVVLSTLGIIPYGRGSFSPTSPYETFVEGNPYFPNVDSCLPFDLTNVPASPVFFLDERIGGNWCKSDLMVMNAVEAGAIAVIILSEDLQAPVLAMSTSPNPFSSAYFRDRMRVPIGTLSPAQRDNLPDTASAESATVRMTFDSLIPEADDVVVQLWLDVDDSCGWPCIRSNEFLVDMANIARQAQNADGIQIEPHWLLNPSCDTGDCKEHCVGNNYCYYSYGSDEVSAEPAGDLAVIQETIRRICLWSFLKNAGVQSVFWDYIINFVRDCSSDKNKFNEACSKSALDNTGHGGDKTAWEQCYQQMDGTDPIPEVEDEIMLAKGTLPSGLVIPYIDRDFRGSVRINDNQYRGALHANFVMDAGCGAYRGNRRTVCDITVEGVCASTDPGTQTCLNDANKAAKTTKCVRNSSGTECTCEVGYLMDSKGVCQDVNECTDRNGILCPQKGLRNVCVNLEGGYKCLYYGDACQAENAGFCWQSEDKKLNACEDNLQAFRDAAKAGKDLPPAAEISHCDCDAIGGKGCYKTIKTPDGLFNTCEKVDCINIGAIVGGLLGGLLICTLAIVAGVWYIRKKRGHSSPLPGSNFMAGFKGGSSGLGAGSNVGTLSKYDEPDVEMAPNPGQPGGAAMAAHPRELKIALERVDMSAQ